MTPAELNSAVEGANAREEAEWYRMAWFTANLLLPHNRDKRGRAKPIDPRSLLPEIFRPKKPAMTKEEARAEAIRIREEIEKAREKNEVKP